MNAITANADDLQGSMQEFNSGKLGLFRFWGYIGFLLGMAALAMFQPAGYIEDDYLSRLFSNEALAWLVGGVFTGLVLAAITQSKEWSQLTAQRLVPWFDGFFVMLLGAAVLSLFEPVSSKISYDDQSNLISGRVVMAMNLLFLAAAIMYILLLFAVDGFIAKLATGFAWLATYTGAIALVLRWYESYLLDIGHAPVSNLYEVFILLFCITTVIYLNMERFYKVHTLGTFLMPLIAAGVFFGLWLNSVGQADIKPLVPALQSYWMKIHVPLNFIGYGSFAIACAAGMLYLLRDWLENNRPKGYLMAVTPSLDMVDEISYRAVAIGFPAFTLATILGAAWAAEAWGGYWSWDPKETWALIVWLVYAAYLHARFNHELRGKVLAWWTTLAFLVTLFCFVGVNMYLSGLHSYGKLS
ncbi:MAG: c-type cytochrome biogenesis protein CcsB [Mariprofundales bacterium]